MYTAKRVSTVNSAFCPAASRRSAQWAYASNNSRIARRSAAPRPWSFLEQPLGEHDLHDARHGLLASPVALQLGRERDPTDRPAAGLHDTLEAGAMRLEGGTADRIDDRIHLVTLAQRVERGEGHADLRPQRAEDEFAPASRPHGANEIGILPGVGAGSIDRRIVFEQLPEWGNGRLASARFDVDRRVHNRKA